MKNDGILPYTGNRLFIIQLTFGIWIETMHQLQQTPTP